MCIRDRLYTGIVISSAGIAMVAISCNTVLPILALTAQNVIMNVMHACYGLGLSLIHISKKYFFSKAILIYGVSLMPILINIFIKLIFYMNNNFQIISNKHFV